MVDLKIQQERTGYPLGHLLKLYGVRRSTYYGWDAEQPAAPPQRRNVLTVLPEEDKAVVEFRLQHREIGYRKLTWLMNDADVAALSESAVYKVLSKHDLLGPWQKADNAETGKEYEHKPMYVHHHWHVDIAYVKVADIFYFLIMLLDGYSRYLLDWELMTDMLSSSVEDFIQQAREKFPLGTPMLIHDNGSQFISRDFKMLVSKLQIQQVFTRRNHPQTNGKIERMNGTVKHEALRVACPNSYQEAWQTIDDFVHYYNHRRLHAGIRYLRPIDMFEGRDQQILQQRKLRLKHARIARVETNLFNFNNKKEEDYSKFLN